MSVCTTFMLHILSFNVEFYSLIVFIFCVTGLAGCVSTLLHDGIMTPTDGKYDSSLS